MTDVKTDHGSLHAGQQALARSDYAAAASEFFPLARQGNASAQYFLGRMYHEGKGVPEDNKIAFRWTRKAAEQGHPEAGSLLGLLYAQGQGVARDDAEAARWFHRAAARGDATGQTKMGMCYMRGLGVPRDHLKAYMWFDLAAARSTGHDLSCNLNLRDTLAGMHLTPAQVSEAQRLARQWKPEHLPLLKRLHLA